MTDQQTSTFQVTGMTCAHCVMSVDEALSEIDGVTTVAVDLQPGGVSTATVTSTNPLDHDTVAAAIEEAGYALADA